MKNVFASIKWFLLVAYVPTVHLWMDISGFVRQQWEEKRLFFFFLLLVLLEHFWRNLCCPQSPLVCPVAAEGIRFLETTAILFHYTLCCYYSTEAEWSHIENLVLASRFVMLHTQMWEVYCLCDAVFWAEQCLRNEKKDTGLGCSFKLGLGLEWGFPHAGMSLCSLIFSVQPKGKAPRVSYQPSQMGHMTLCDPDGL